MLMLFSEWDADFATEAYRQQVQVLAQHQVRLINGSTMSFCSFSLVSLVTYLIMFVVDGGFGK